MALASKLLIVILMIFSLISYGQKVKFGPDLDGLSVSGSGCVLEGDAAEAYIIKDKSVSRIDNGTTLRYTKDVVSGSDDHYILYTNEQLYTLYASYNSKAKSMEVYKQAIDKNTGEHKGNAQKIMEIQSDKGFIQIWAHFYSIFSPDSSRILILATTESSKDFSTMYALQVCDKDLKPLWNKNEEIGLQDICNPAVDNDGNVSMTMIKFQKSDKKGWFSDPTEGYLMTYLNDGKDRMKTTLPGKNAFARSYTGPNGNLLLVELYTSGNKTDRAEGINIISVEPKTGKVTGRVSKEFDDELRKEMTAGLLDKSAGGVYSLAIKKVIMDNEGGAVILAEQGYTVKDNSNSIVFGVANGIIAISLNNAGDIEWMKMIPKRQMLPGHQSFVSFASYTKGNDIYIIYNDNEKNEKKGKDEMLNVFTGCKHSQLIRLTLSSTGEIKKEPIYTYDNDFGFEPTLCKMLDNGDLMFVASNLHKKLKIGYITTK